MINITDNIYHIIILKLDYLGNALFGSYVTFWKVNFDEYNYT